MEDFALYCSIPLRVPFLLWDDKDKPLYFLLQIIFEKKDIFFRPFLPAFLHHKPEFLSLFSNPSINFLAVNRVQMYEMISTYQAILQVFLKLFCLLPLILLVSSHLILKNFWMTEEIYLRIKKCTQEKYYRRILWFLKYKWVYYYPLRKLLYWFYLYPDCKSSWHSGTINEVTIPVLTRIKIILICI